MRQLPVRYLEEVPIVAFTANAMKEAQESFYEAGMNGFIPKPIEVEELFRAVRQYLPKEKVVLSRQKDIPFVAPQSEEGLEFDLKDIDVQEGIKNAGSTNFYMDILSDFYLLIDTKSLKIEKCMEDALWRDYTVEVHALKTNTRLIGATDLSLEFAQLERFGRDENEEKIQSETPLVLSHYRALKDVLRPFYQKNEKEKRNAETEEIIMYLHGIRDAVEGFDLSTVDEAMEKLEECLLPVSVGEKMEQLRVAVADVAMEDILQIVEEMTNLIC